MKHEPIASADAYVLDVGTLNTYWGYAGDDEPKVCMTSAWCQKGAADWSKLPAEFLQFREHYRPQYTSTFGSLPEPLRAYAHQDPPLAYKNAKAKGDMEEEVSKGKENVIPRLSRALYWKTLQHINEFYGDGERLTGRPLLVSQPTKCPPKHARALAEIAFEKLDVGAFYAMRKASLAAMGMGRATSCVVELGPVSTTVTPVFEGFTLQRRMQQYAVGGLLQDWMLASSTRLWDANGFDGDFHPYSELRKNRQRFGTFPVQGEPNDTQTLLKSVDPTYLHYSRRRIVQDLKENVLRVNNFKPVPGSAANRPARGPDEPEDIPYELPDGKVIYVPDQTARDVSEFLLTPSESYTALQCLRPYSENLSPMINGFPGMSHAVISACFDSHVDIRPTLFQNVVVVGGPSAVDGFMERVASDLNTQQKANVCRRDTLTGPVEEKHFKELSTFKIKVASQVPMERKFTTWVGGSVMAMLTTFRDMWISREEWTEFGPCILERRKLFV